MKHLLERKSWEIRCFERSWREGWLPSNLAVKRESGFLRSSPLSTNDQAETINDARQSVSSTFNHTYHIFCLPQRIILNWVSNTVHQFKLSIKWQMLTRAWAISGMDSSNDCIFLWLWLFFVFEKKRCERKWNDDNDNVKVMNCYHLALLKNSLWKKVNLATKKLCEKTTLPNYTVIQKCIESW